MEKPKVEIKKLSGDKTDPSLYILNVDEYSIFESHDKKQTEKAKQLVDKVFKVSDFYLCIYKLETFIESVIKK